MKFSLVVYKKILFTFSVELEEIFPFVIVLLFGGRQTKSEKKDDGKNEIKSLINHYKDLTKTILIKRQQSEEKISTRMCLFIRIIITRKSDCFIK